MHFEELHSSRSIGLVVRDSHFQKQSVSTQATVNISGYVSPDRSRSRSSPSPHKIQNILQVSKRLIEEAIASGNCDLDSIDPHLVFHLGDEPAPADSSYTHVVNERVLGYNIIRDPAFRPGPEHRLQPAPSLLPFSDLALLRESENPLKFSLRVAVDDDASPSDAALSQPQSRPSHRSRTKIVEYEEPPGANALGRLSLGEEGPEVLALLERVRCENAGLAAQVEQCLAEAAAEPEKAFGELRRLAKISPIFAEVCEEIIKKVSNSFKTAERASFRRMRPGSLVKMDVEMSVVSNLQQSLPAEQAPEPSYAATSFAPTAFPPPSFAPTSFEQAVSAHRSNERNTLSSDKNLLFSSGAQVHNPLGRSSPPYGLQGLISNVSDPTDARRLPSRSSYKSDECRDEITMTDPLPPFAIHNRISSVSSKKRAPENCYASLHASGEKFNSRVEQSLAPPDHLGLMSESLMAGSRLVRRVTRSGERTEVFSAPMLNSISAGSERVVSSSFLQSSGPVPVTGTSESARSQGKNPEISSRSEFEGNQRPDSILKHSRSGKDRKKLTFVADEPGFSTPQEEAVTPPSTFAISLYKSGPSAPSFTASISVSQQSNDQKAAARSSRRITLDGRSG